jgi:hypothetical protein
VNFRLRAFLLHLVFSGVVLTIVLAAFYVGWYQWPGWYLAGADLVVGVMLAVDVGLGPMATLTVSSPTKSRRELTRDIGLIVAIQVFALAYGVQTLWVGRPLFYAFSLDRITLVQANTIEQDSIKEAVELRAPFIPDWTSLPTWVWAPLPVDDQQRRTIISSAIVGGSDVTDMPKYFRPWVDGHSEIAGVQRPLDYLALTSDAKDEELRRKLDALGRPKDSLSVLRIEGRSRFGAMVLDSKTSEPLLFLPKEVAVR